jgi:hypothetical protein
MASKTSGASSTNTPQAFITPAVNKATFDALCDLLTRNTTDAVTLMLVKKAQRSTRPIPGVPGIMPDVPADYAVGLAKIQAIAKRAGEGGVLKNDVVCEQIAYFITKAEGIDARAEASETAVAMREAKARARREMLAK